MKKSKSFTITKPSQTVQFEVKTDRYSDEVNRVSVSSTVKQGAAKKTYFGAGNVGLTGSEIMALNGVDRFRTSVHEVLFTADHQRLYYAYPAIFGNISAVFDSAGDNVTNGFIRRNESFQLEDGNMEQYVILEGTLETSLTNFLMKFYFV